jgi:membrane-associated phospholipid phosphatase
LPASLITAGALCIPLPPLRTLNQTIKYDMNRLRHGRPFHADDYLQYLPVGGYFGLGALGVRAKHTFTDRLVIGATAYIGMSMMVNGLKYSVRNMRPDGTARNSFPSGHTATAFCGAELIRMEYGKTYGWIAYAVATSVGILRVYNGRHWAKDVLAGAGIGILSARIGSVLHWKIIKRRPPLRTALKRQCALQQAGALQTFPAIRQTSLALAYLDAR